MNAYEIYWHDLNDEAQDRLNDLYHDNVDLTPLAIVNLEKSLPHDN